MIDESKESTPGRVAERRTHPRYVFTADAEIAEPETDARIEARIIDISQQGCHVETPRSFPLGTAIRVQVTKGGDSFVVPARVVFSSVKGMGLAFAEIPKEQHEILEKWLGPLRARHWLILHRRKTQRVILRVPIRVSQHKPDSHFDEETHTLSLSAHGASILLSASVGKGQRLELLNIATGDRAECIVAYLGQGQGDRIEVGVEFVLPNPQFWHVAFPPKDWSQPISDL
jgi:PilZ domain-containing protein